MCTIISAHKKKNNNKKNTTLAASVIILLGWEMVEWYYTLMCYSNNYASSLSLYIYIYIIKKKILCLIWNLPNSLHSLIWKIKIFFVAYFLPWPRGMQCYISHFSSRYSPLPLVIMMEWLHVRVTVSVSRVQTRIWMP